jgi:hypothetical protein
MTDFFDRLELQLETAAAGRPTAQRWRGRPTPGIVLVAVSSLLVLAIAVALMVVLHRGGRTAPAATSPSPQSYVNQAIATVARRDPACNDDLVEEQASQGAPPAFVSMLSVLRRPQTARDLAYPPAMRSLMMRAPRPRTLIDTAENWGTVYINAIRRLPDAGGEATYLVPLLHGVRTSAPRRCVEAQGKALSKLLPRPATPFGQSIVDAATTTFRAERRVIHPIEVLALMQIPLHPEHLPLGGFVGGSGTCCGYASRLRSGQGPEIGWPGYLAIVVPDGVTSVSVTWPAVLRHAQITHSARAIENVAIVRKPIPDYAPPQSIVWHRGAGTSAIH